MSLLGNTITMSSIGSSEAEAHNSHHPTDSGDAHPSPQLENLSPPPSQPRGIIDTSGVEMEKVEYRNHMVVRKMEITEDITREGTTCPICLDEFKLGEIAVKLGCDHFFCFECIQGWINLRNYSCPVCRRTCIQIEMAQLVRILDRLPLHTRRRFPRVIIPGTATTPPLVMSLSRLANEEIVPSPSQLSMNNNGELSSYESAFDEVD